MKSARIGLLVPVVLATGIVFLWAVGGARGQEYEAQRGRELLDSALEQMAAGQYDRAQHICWEAIQILGEMEFEGRLVLAEIYAAQGLFEEAQRQAARACVAAQTEQEGARAQAALERYGKAQRRLERRTSELGGQAQDPAAGEQEAIQVAVGLIDALSIAGRSEEAAAKCRELLGRFPDSSEAATRGLSRLRLLRLRQEGPEAAVSELEAIIAAHPGMAVEGYATYYIGQIHEAGGELDTAVARYEEAASKLQGTAGAPAALERILETQRRAGQFDEAVETANRIIMQYPQSPSALRAIEKTGQVLLSLGRLEEAKTTFTSVMQRDPESPIALRSLEVMCEIYAEADRLAEADQVVETVRLEHADRDWRSSRLADIYYWHGQKMHRNGEKLSAISWWEREALLEKDPALSVETVIRIAFTYSALGQHVRARETMSRVLESSEQAFREKHLLAQDYIAGTYLREGKLELALQAYERALGIAKHVGHARAEADISGAIERLKGQLSQGAQ